VPGLPASARNHPRQHKQSSPCSRGDQQALGNQQFRLEEWQPDRKPENDAGDQRSSRLKEPTGEDRQREEGQQPTDEREPVQPSLPRTEQAQRQGDRPDVEGWLVRPGLHVEGEPTQHPPGGRCIACLIGVPVRLKK